MCDVAVAVGPSTVAVAEQPWDRPLSLRQPWDRLVSLWCKKQLWDRPPSLQKAAVGLPTFGAATLEPPTVAALEEDNPLGFESGCSSRGTTQCRCAGVATGVRARGIYSTSRG